MARQQRQAGSEEEEDRGDRHTGKRGGEGRKKGMKELRDKTRKPRGKLKNFQKLHCGNHFPTYMSTKPS